MTSKEKALSDLLAELFSEHEMRGLALDLRGPPFERELYGGRAKIALTLALGVAQDDAVEELFAAVKKLRTSPNLKAKIERVEQVWKPGGSVRRARAPKRAWVRPLFLLAPVCILVTGLVLLSRERSLDAGTDPEPKTVSEPKAGAKPKDAKLVIDDVDATRDSHKTLDLDLKVRKIDLDIVNMTHVWVRSFPDPSKPSYRPPALEHAPPSHVYAEVRSLRAGEDRAAAIAISQVLDREKFVDRFIVRIVNLCVRPGNILWVEVRYNGTQWTNVWKGRCPAHRPGKRNLPQPGYLAIGTDFETESRDEPDVLETSNSEAKPGTHQDEAR